MSEQSMISVLPDSLVSTLWLAEHLDEPALRIVDIRGYVNTVDLGGGRQRAEYAGALDEYQAAHIPGAVYVDWTVDIVDPDNPVKAQIASPERFKAAMEERGIGDDTDVVAIDHTGGHFATRLWWALRYYGHDRVAVLNGGMNQWLAEGRPTTTKEPRPVPATFTPSLRPELIADAKEVLAAIDRPQHHIVDARDDAQYSGAAVRHSRGGHVPGAVNISSKNLVNADGTWKSDADLSTVLKVGGVDPGDRVIAYCNGGVTATAVLFALARTGHDDFANYDGSWNEWGERPDLPAETGNR